MAVLGVDACRTGWAGVVLEDGHTVTGVFAADFGSLAAPASAAAEIAAIAVDIPIGLPDNGKRAADVLARRIVGPRWRSVFMTPVRAVLSVETHAAATRRSVELTGVGISQQAYALLPRIAEVDAWATASGIPVIEVHPEVSFVTLAGGHLSHPKKSWAGAMLRRALLTDAGINVPNDLGQLGGLASVDDVLDAAVAAWSARRFVAGTATSFPDPPEVFSDGHHSAIWA